MKNESKNNSNDDDVIKHMNVKNRNLKLLMKKKFITIP